MSVGITRWITRWDNDADNLGPLLPSWPESSNEELSCTAWYIVLLACTRWTPNTAPWEYSAVLYLTYTRAKMESPNVKAMRMMEAEVSVTIESLFPRKRTTVMPAKSRRNNSVQQPKLKPQQYAPGTSEGNRERRAQFHPALSARCCGIIKLNGFVFNRNYIEYQVGSCKTPSSDQRGLVKIFSFTRHTHWARSVRLGVAMWTKIIPGPLSKHKLRRYSLLIQCLRFC